MRIIEKIRCSCGGSAVEVEPTIGEAQAANTTCTCCLRVFMCSTCRTRFAFTFEAPEADYRD